jgi:PAS domain S-box-containing protein
MEDQEKTTEQLVSELGELRQRNAELEAFEAEHKRAEKALRDNQERYRALSNASFEAIFISEKGICIDTNQTATKMFGYDYDELIGIFGTDVIAPEFKELVPYEAIAQRKDGTTFQVEIRGKMTEYKGRSVRVTVVHDINKRKQAEEALRKARDQLERRVGERTADLMELNEQLRQEIEERKRIEQVVRESEEQYRVLVEQANDGILIVQDGMIKFANRRLAEANGRTVEEIVNTNFLDYVRPDEVPIVANRYRRRLAGEDVEQIYETVLLHREGHEIPVEINAGAMTYQGSPAVLAFIRVTTERKLAEEALRQSEEKLRAVVEASPLPMLTIQSGGIVTLWNPAAESLFGWSEDEVLGKYIPIVPRDRQEEHRNLRRRTFQRGEVLTGLEVVRRKKDGRRHQRAQADRKRPQAK